MSKELKRISNYFSRALFCKEDNESVLLNFVNGFIEDNNEKPFKEIEILSPYNYKNHITDTETIVDVKAKNNDGEIIIVEIQSYGSRIFINRQLEYWVKNFTTQAEMSRQRAIELNDPSLRKPKRIISIAIVDFIMFPDDHYAHTVHKICNVRNGKVSTDILELHILELPKAIETIKNRDLALWAIFFGSNNFEEDKIMLAEQNVALKKAVNDYDFFREDKDFVSEYEKHEIFLTGIQMMKDEAVADGHAEGLAKGHAKGLTEGMRQKALDTAKKLHEMGLSIEQIAQATDLTVEEIKKIS